MITETVVETKCPFMQTGGFICIKRKCAMYANDKCSIAYLPEIAKQRNEATTESDLDTLFASQEKLITEFREMNIQQNNNTAMYNANLQGITGHIQEIISKRNEDMENYNKDTKVIADSIKALQHKTETLEKTLATLKKEFAEFEKQMKKRK